MDRDQALNEGKMLIESGDFHEHGLQRSYDVYKQKTGRDWPYSEDELIIATMIIEADDPLEDNELGNKLSVWTLGADTAPQGIA